MKTEVYSWRLSADLKAELEREARRRNTSLSAVIDIAVKEWLSNTAVADDDEAQVRLHTAASKCLGAFAGNDPHRAGNARQTLRQRLSRQYGR
jgi:hypothetical protein